MSLFSRAGCIYAFRYVNSFVKIGRDAEMWRETTKSCFHMLGNFSTGVNLWLFKYLCVCVWGGAEIRFYCFVGQNICMLLNLE